ncbi:hypothetical protein KDL29_05765 [bacterium]|nr:hypothetical protein [bacterium]
MNQKVTTGQASKAGWILLCKQLHELLELPDPTAFGELRLQAAALLRGMPAGDDATRFQLELQLLDIFAALYLCSPQDARRAWRMLDEGCARLSVSTPNLLATTARVRYIAALQMLQAGLIERGSIDPLAIRRELLLEDGPDSLLLDAMLTEALLRRDHALAMHACCLARSFENKPEGVFELRFRQLSLALLEQRGTTGQLAELLGSASTYADWQKIDGAIWQLCLEADLIPLENWHKHLEAHERCHDWIYREIARLGS